MTRLDINFSKSTLVSWNVNNQLVEELASEVNCNVLFVPLTYLGVPIGQTQRTTSFGNPSYKN